MATTTVVEKMPLNWDEADKFGDGWTDAAGAWRRAFSAWLTENYPDLSLVGNELYGPATYRFDGLDMQRDTKPAAELKRLPEDGVYEEFAELHRDDWSELLEKFGAAA